MAIENIKGLAHIGFFVKKLAVTKEFYCNILGFKCIFEKIESGEQGKVEIAFLQRGDLMLEVIDVQGLKFPPDGCFQHLAMRVQDIEQTQKKLEATGIKTDKLIYAPDVFAHGAKWVTFLGPDGEHLEINEVI